MARTLTVSVPDNLYQRLEAGARTADQSVGDFVIRRLSRDVPLAPESDLPPAIRAELTAMEQLSDDALWLIARGAVNADKVAMLDVLLERQLAGELTPEGQQLLTQLREEADAFTLRKAHAYALLQQRGHPLPTLAVLRDQHP
jgi:hypothetical protein